MNRLTRTGLLLLAGSVLLMPACAGDGHFTLLGYTTRPNYDTNIRTVYMPIFENRTFFRGLEYELHMALQNALLTRTPYRITSNRAEADTELEGKIVNFQRNLVLISPNNSNRTEETTLVVELRWTDLRTGESLSRRQRRPGDPVPLDLPPPGSTVLPGVMTPGAPTAPTPLMQEAEGNTVGGPAIVPLPGKPPKKEPPVTITSLAQYTPELGESITVARQRNCERMAIQIVNMMQIPW